MKKTTDHYFSRKWFVLILSFLVFLLVNLITNITSPQYKYYKENMQVLFDRQSTFERKITNDLLPALYLLFTNHPPSSSSLTQSSNSKPSSTASVSDLPCITAEKSQTIYFQWFLNSGVPHFQYCNQSFGVGDDFFGFPIVQINKTSFRTSDCLYLLQPLNTSLHVTN